MIHVVAPGMLTSVQDLGRHGFAHLGVGTAGAMDSPALRLANALVGNEDNAAALEVTLRGPTLRFDTPTLIALTGGEVATPMWRPVFIDAETTLDIGALHSGCRTYLAVAGGLRAPMLMSSRSADINGGIGRALVAGDTLAHDPYVEAASHAAWSLDPAPWFDAHDDAPIHLIRGAHFAHLDATSRKTLFTREFRIDTQSNRVGYRLTGETLRLSEPLELISEGVTPGTVQLPPGGAPIVLMREAPTTGGYPRIGHIASVDLPRLAQRRPGQIVRFADISPADARTMYLRRERELRVLQRSIADRRDTNR
ncbi:MAG TPA: biotin-dependent carboxyltransferase family protein [Rudaea sp.]|jgi:antagonist of KipI|nr:biotin-dependent carboxyltransferase family protein [Rudaea sp.]